MELEEGRAGLGGGVGVERGEEGADGGRGKGPVVL